MPLSTGRLRGVIPVLKTGSTPASGLLGTALSGAIQSLKPMVTPEPLIKAASTADPVMGALRGNSSSTPALRGGPVTDLQRRSKGGYRP